MAKGWIQIHRQIKDCWVWQNSLYLKAWMDLLLSANHRDVKIPFDGQIITVKAGQLITSRRNLMASWGCSINTVKKILDLLESDEMIVRESDHRRTLITIVNYEKYQGFAEHTETGSDTPIDTVSDTPSDTPTDTPDDTVSDTIGDTIGDNKQYSINNANNVNNVDNVDNLLIPHIPLAEEPEKKAKKKSDPVSEFEPLFSEYLWTEEMKDTIRDWIRYKAERNEYYKPTSRKTLLKQVDKAITHHGETTVEEAILNAMANNYQGMGLDRISTNGSGRKNTQAPTQNEYLERLKNL